MSLLKKVTRTELSEFEQCVRKKLKGEPLTDEQTSNLIRLAISQDNKVMDAHNRVVEAEGITEIQADTIADTTLGEANAKIKDLEFKNAIVHNKLNTLLVEYPELQKAHKNLRQQLVETQKIVQALKLKLGLKTR